MTINQPPGPENAPMQQPAYPPIYQPPVMPPPAPQSGAPVAPAPKGLAIAALIVGIVAFLAGLVPFLGIILGLVGLALGIIALVKRQPKSLALTGTILAGVAVVVSIIATIVAGAFTAAVIGAAEGQTSVTTEAPGESEVSPNESESDSAGAGSRENPFPIGTTIVSADWDVVVNSVNLSANDAVAGANSFNDPAPAGQQYAVVNVTVTYKGEDTGIPYFVEIDYVTKTGEVISTWDSFAVAPDPTFGSGELYAGGASTGNLAFLIPSSADGVLRIAPGIFADDVFVATK
jgi:hypothetical protein